MEVGERNLLIIGLEKYMAERMQENARNYVLEKAYEKDRKSGGTPTWPEYKTGIKAKYNHARIILEDLLKQQEDDIKTWF